MTNGAATTCIVAANLMLAGVSTVAQAAAEGVANPVLAVLQSGGVASVLAVFCWHFMRRAKVLDEKLEAERRKCKDCIFVKRANEDFINNHTDEKK